MNSQTYWRWQERRLTILAAILAAAVLVGLPLLVAGIDQRTDTRFSTGFLITILGGLPLLVVIVFWYCARQNRVERELDVFSDD